MSLLGISGNYLAIAAGAVTAFLIGTVWYMFLFGKQWSAAHGFSEQKVKQMQGSAPIAAGVSFVGYLLTAYVLFFLFKKMGITSMNDALSMGFILWLGFPAPIGLMNTLYAGRSLTVYLIDASYQLLYILAMSALLVTLS